MYISAQASYDRSHVKVWERTDQGRIIKEYPSPLYFYLEDPNGKYRDYKGTKLAKLEFDNYNDYYDSAKKLKAQGKKLWESDIPLEYKVLSQHYFNNKSTTNLNVAFYDIEIDYDKTRGMPDIYNEPYAPINAISLYSVHTGKMLVLAVPPDKNFKMKHVSKEVLQLAEIRLFYTEKELLLSFIDELEDVDILSGWNSEGFDDIYIYQRLKMVCGEEIVNKLSFDKARKPYLKDKQDTLGKVNPVLVTSGRCLIDLMLVMIKFEPGERDSFALEAVAEEKLPDLPKLEYEGSLADLYKNDFNFFLRYNIRDCEILKGFEEKFGYIKLAILMYHMDTGLLNDVLGTIRLTEMAIINYCHHTLNIVVNDKEIDGETSDKKFGGAFVLNPIVGLHEWVGSIDVNSLYPSSMMSVNISFDTLVGQFTDTDIAYENVIQKTDKKLSFIFEDGSVEFLTGKEWNSLLREMNCSISGYGTVFNLDKKGIIPSLLKEWFSKRKQFKNKSEEFEKKFLELESTDPNTAKKYQDEHKLYDLMQKVFKLKLNSTYGACGNRFFRFFDVRMAESTTKTGRQILYHMAKSISKFLDGKYVYPNEYVIAGDTDSNLFKTLENNYEACSKKAKDIADFINSSFNSFSQEHFLLSEDYLNIFKVSQETISDRCIFTKGKKNYMMHIVEKDGIKVDKMVTKGLQIKKTNTPKLIRKMLSQHFERFLKGEPWKSVGLSILEQREKLLNAEKLDLDRLGLPKRVNKLDEYIQYYQNGQKGVTITGHAMAAIHWNKCLEANNDKESMKILSGMRIKTFYLKKKIGNFKSIAIPVDLKNIPKWFTEQIEPLIDRDEQIVRVIDQVCKPLLDAIGEELPTRKTLLVQDLVEFE
jgi:DNA polymerase elongation subunit (family B)